MWAAGCCSRSCRKSEPPKRRSCANGVAAELKTMFASHYTQIVSLPQALQLQHIAVYSKRATGEKYLINPNKVG